MKLEKIKEYNKTNTPHRNKFLSFKNIISIIAIGLLTFTIGCSSNIENPNPFSPMRAIEFNIAPQNNSETEVEIKIYNTKGDLVRHLFNGSKSAGNHSIKWDGKDDEGNFLGTGVYFYQLIIAGKKETKKFFYSN